MRRTLTALTLTAALLGLTPGTATATPLDAGHKWTNITTGHKWTSASPTPDVTYRGATRIYTTSYWTADRQCKTARGAFAWVRGPFTDWTGRTYFECIR